MNQASADWPGAGAIPTSNTVRSSASSTPCGTPSGASTKSPADCFEASLAHDESRLSTHDEIEFVRAGVRVHALYLTWLEAVQPDEQAGRAETVDLGHL